MAFTTVVEEEKTEGVTALMKFKRAVKNVSTVGGLHFNAKKRSMDKKIIRLKERKYAVTGVAEERVD